MTERISQSPLSSIITNVIASERYSVLKVREYNGNSNPYKYVCHFKQKIQIVFMPIEKLEVIKCKTLTIGLLGPALLWFL